MLSTYGLVSHRGDLSDFHPRKKNDKPALLLPVTTKRQAGLQARAPAGSAQLRPVGLQYQRILSSGWNCLSGVGGDRGIVSAGASTVRRLSGGLRGHEVPWDVRFQLMAPEHSPRPVCLPNPSLPLLPAGRELRLKQRLLRVGIKEFTCGHSLLPNYRAQHGMKMWDPLVKKGMGR